MDEIAPVPRWDVPLKLLGGLHHLVLSGQASWADLPTALAEHRGFLARFVGEQSVQTNEVRRCWFLVPAFLLVAERAAAERIDLIELGPSAGLNLVWDRYRCRYDAGTWGPVDARLELTGEERRQVPAGLLGRRLEVGRRTGVDLEPVDVTTDEGALLLKSFVWADQHDRLDRLDRAIDALRADPPELVRGDYVELLPDLLERRAADLLTVVFQTSSMIYLSDEQRARVYQALGAAGREAPLGWISSARPLDERLHASGLEVGLWPDEPRVAMHVDYHGAWLDWLA